MYIVYIKLEILLIFLQSLTAKKIFSNQLRLGNNHSVLLYTKAKYKTTLSLLLFQ